MLRRLTACLMALLLFAAVPAHAVDVGDLAIFSQWDERFDTPGFRYNNNYFRFVGCGPASIGNGLIAAMGITDQDLGVGVMQDTLNLLTSFSPAKNKIQIGRLSYLNFTEAELAAGNERYPSLNQALQLFGGPIRYIDGYMNAERLEQNLATLTGQRALLHGTFGSSDRWTILCDISKALFAAGYDESVIVVAFLGAGTSDTQSPFRSGTAGHYLSICIPIKSFSETGVFYVLDSLPRALYDDPYGPHMLYMNKYDFVGRQKYTTSLDRFNELFVVERVEPTIVRVVPQGETLDAITTAEKDGTLPMDAFLPYFTEVVQFYGTSHVFIALAKSE